MISSRSYLGSFSSFSKTYNYLKYPHERRLAHISISIKPSFYNYLIKNCEFVIIQNILKCIISSLSLILELLTYFRHAISKIFVFVRQQNLYLQNLRKLQTKNICYLKIKVNLDYSQLHFHKCIYLIIRAWKKSLSKPVFTVII